MRVRLKLQYSRTKLKLYLSFVQPESDNANHVERRGAGAAAEGEAACGEV